MIIIISICITLVAPVVIDSAKELVNNLQTSVVNILNKYEQIEEDTMINQEIAKIVLMYLQGYLIYFLHSLFLFMYCQREIEYITFLREQQMHSYQKIM